MTWDGLKIFGQPHIPCGVLHARRGDVGTYTVTEDTIGLVAGSGVIRLEFEVEKNVAVCVPWVICFDVESSERERSTKNKTEIREP